MSKFSGKFSDRFPDYIFPLKEIFGHKMKKLKFSVEQLIHFTCGACGYTWSHSGEMPRTIIYCSSCQTPYVDLDLENVTQEKWYYCSPHDIWYKEKCPLHESA